MTATELMEGISGKYGACVTPSTFTSMDILEGGLEMKGRVLKSLGSESQRNRVPTTHDNVIVSTEFLEKNCKT